MSVETKTDRSGPLRAATSRRPVLTVAHHRRPELIGQRHVLREGAALVLGRGSRELAGALDDTRISRRHLRLSQRDGGWVVSDLGSHNGTYVNGERLAGAGSLTPGDVVGAGRVLLLFHHEALMVPEASTEGLVSVSGAMAEVLEQIRLVAPRPVSVLVAGETGTGKELVARRLHDQSGRSGRFVAVNCGAVTDGVLLSELFGHTRGAFSGAEGRRGGLVEAAAGGTLFLDEIGDASPALQASLLRLLEQREFRPVGGDEPRTSDARFVAATHVSLEDAVSEGRFRRDLLGRLEQWVIRVPPLRDRREDILPLAHHFAARDAGRSVALHPHLAEALLLYEYPANVRQLAAIVQQAVVEAEAEGLLRLTDRVASRLRRRRPAPADAKVDSPPDSRATPAATSVERPTADELRARFTALAGNARVMARELGVGRTTLYRWFKAAGMDPAQLRTSLREDR